MDRYDVAHDWANRTDNNASASSSNLFFASGAIYSYGDHFMIAKHVWNEQGEHAVLFTERTYSRTTSKHIEIVARASAHLTKIFVPDPASSKYELFERWYASINELAHHLGTARKPEKYVLQMQQLFNQAERYADFFGYELPEQLIALGNVQNFDEFVVHLKKERESQEAKEKKQQRKWLSVQKKQLKDWRSFQRNNLRTYDGLDYLRFHVKTGQIETTQGVRFPLSAGHRLYQFVITTNAKGGCTNCDILFLDKYTVSEVNKKFIHVGCHRVTLKEIKSFAKQQGWVEPSPLKHSLLFT